MSFDKNNYLKQIKNKTINKFLIKNNNDRNLKIKIQIIN